MKNSNKKLSALEAAEVIGITRDTRNFEIKLTLKYVKDYTMPSETEYSVLVDESGDYIIDESGNTILIRS